MKRFLQLFVIFVLVSFFSMSTVSAGCIQTHVDRGYFTESDEVRGYLVATHESNCLAERVAYKISRYDQIVGFVQVDEQSAEIPTTDRVRREAPAFTLKGRESGLYRVDSYAVDLQESLFFTIGAFQSRNQFYTLGGADGRFDMGRLPYIKPAAVTNKGWLYFRGLTAGSLVAYLYQPRPDMTEMISVMIEQVDQQDKAVFTNMPNVRGGVLDLPWMRVKLPNNSFDSTRPLFISIRTKEGLTINGMVYDPGDPSQFFNGFATDGDGR